MSECQCEAAIDEQFEEQFDITQEEVNIVGKSFIEIRGEEIINAGYVNGKFKDKDLYVVSYVDINNASLALDEFHYEKLVPLEMFVMKDFRFYAEEVQQSWGEDVSALIERKKKIVEERELARKEREAKEKENKQEEGK